MDPVLLGIVPATLAAVGGIIVAISGRKEARAKAALSPLDVTDRTLAIAKEWIDRLQREIKDNEMECDRKLAVMEAELAIMRQQIEHMASRAWMSE